MLGHARRRWDMLGDTRTRWDRLGDTRTCWDTLGDAGTGEETLGQARTREETPTVRCIAVPVGSLTCTTLSCRPAVMKSSSVSTFRMKLALIGFGRSCGETEQSRLTRQLPGPPTGRLRVHSYLVCDVVELHQTLQGSRDDGAEKTEDRSVRRCWKGFSKGLNR